MGAGGTGEVYMQHYEILGELMVAGGVYMKY